MPQKTTKEGIDRQEGKTTVQKKGWYRAYDMIYEQPISGYAKHVYNYLTRCADANDQCFPSHKDIAKKCGFGVTTIKKALNELIEIGVIAKEKRTRVDGGQSSDLYTIFDAPQVLTEDAPQVLTEDAPQAPTELPPLDATRLPPQSPRGDEGLPTYKGLPIEGQLGVNALIERDINSTDTNISQSVRLSSRTRTRTRTHEDKTPVDIDLTRKRIRDNIEINIIKPAYYYLANELVEIIVDVLHIKPGQYIRLAGEEKPLAVVQSVFLKIDQRHIIHAIERFQTIEKPITNKRGYLRTVLYSAWLEYESHFENENAQW